MKFDYQTAEKRLNFKRETLEEVSRGLKGDVLDAVCLILALSVIAVLLVL